MNDSTFPIYKGKIDQLTKKGEGLGPFISTNGVEKVLQVPFTIVGEDIEAVFCKKGQGFPLKIVTPSPERVTPRCIHFGVCGGCSYQHMSEKELLRNKELYIKEIYSFVEPLHICPIIASFDSWSWRNKMEFTFSQDKEGRKYLGLMAKWGRAGRVFNLRECPISSSAFLETLNAAKAFWEKSTLKAYHPYRNSGSLRTLTVRVSKRTNERLAFLTVSGVPEFALSKQDIRIYVEEMRASFPNISLFLVIQQAIEGKVTQFYEMHLSGKDHLEEILYFEGRPLKFQISPRAFFQPNTPQAEVIYTKALEMLELKGTETVFDLFCGTGTLSLFAAQKVAHVTAIELSYEAILDARTNAKLNNIENVTFLQGDVGLVLSKNFQTLKAVDICLIDPPRSGLTAEQIEQILRLNAKKILYISCNPTTQAQNIATFLKLGYALKRVQPIDQFPHTPHVEAIALLERIV